MEGVDLKDIELLPEPEDVEPALAPLPEPRSYRVMLSRGIKLHGHILEPQQIGTIELKYGLDPIWVSAFNDIRFVPE